VAKHLALHPDLSFQKISPQSFASCWKSSKRKKAARPRTATTEKLSPDPREEGKHDQG
jgi:hypothetical protein